MYHSPPSVIGLRLSYYWRRKGKDIRHLTAEQRRISAYTLFEHFGFSNSEIAALLNVPRRTILADRARFLDLIRIYPRLSLSVQSLRTFLLYNDPLTPR